MSDGSDNLVLIYLRRLDAKIDALRDDKTEVRSRRTALVIQVGHLAATEARHYAITSGRLDRVESRPDRIERRLDLVAEHA